MKLGTKTFPDDCPNCGIKLLKVPGCRLIREGGPAFSTFSMRCLVCNFETETIKIRDDYYLKKKKDIEDVTPYKDSIFTRFIKKISNII